MSKGNIYSGEFNSEGKQEKMLALIHVMANADRDLRNYRGLCLN